MKVALLHWLNLEFVEISCEARRGANAAEQADDAFDQARQALELRGLNLNHTIRSRIFGIDRPSRDAISECRAVRLAGEARAASSSFIAPKRFSSRALVALDLIAMRAPPGATKTIKEYDPPKRPLCYLTLGPLLALSGNTSQLPGLAAQLKEDILPRTQSYLKHAGGDWGDVVNVSCFLHEDQDPDELRRHFATMAHPFPPRFEIFFVEGFSAPRKLVEVEVTALRKA